MENAAVEPSTESKIPSNAVSGAAMRGELPVAPPDVPRARASKSLRYVNLRTSRPCESSGKPYIPPARSSHDNPTSHNVRAPSFCIRYVSSCTCQRSRDQPNTAAIRWASDVRTLPSNLPIFILAAGTT